MSKTVNKVILVGYVGNNPDTHYFEDENGVTKFPLATSESWKNKKGEKQEKTEWHNVVCKINRLVDIVDEYVNKGDLVYIEGKIQTRSYEDKEGNTKYISEIWMDKLTMMGGKDQEKEETPAKATKKPRAKR
jgi:single-strand DNA-binding protein